MDTTTAPTTGQLIGYCRTSTASQSLASQTDALEAAGCSKIFSDHGVTGAAARRPGDEDLGNSSDPLTEIPQLSAEVVCC
jgi:hypothetical protein